ncbi:hypothetical protein [Amycolatopsis nalaikhensis]|uniref:Uncharacterized protein n=1 Tax=Amycolatopsis nalaikhensis TaxID=715472 RepID=A0ABY8XZ30_9PSEU|nr:hypothetical protein [Amycolatopsis sp. 2-2]WIV60610.1 hypothetical protein QP939_19385 [Amycolatopsis sp. 2-2]
MAPVGADGGCAPADSAAQRILDAAEADGIPRNEVLTVVEVVYAVRNGVPRRADARANER